MSLLLVALCARVRRAPAAPGASVSFRFHAGAPLLASAVTGLDGSIFVGGADGYVHALRSDGSYRWSLSLHGAVARPPLPAPDRVYVATTADRLYALDPDGTLAWVFAAPAGFESDLALALNGLVYFVGRDLHLYGVTAHGSVAVRLPVGEVSAGPIVADTGDIWLGSASGELVRPSLSGSLRKSVSGPVHSALSSQGELYFLVGQELWRASASGATLYRVPGILDSAGAASITTEGDCVWFDDVGKVESRLSPCPLPGARPALGPSRELLLPLDDGKLAVATPHGVLRIAVANSCLLTPNWSPVSGVAIVSSREGLVAGIRLVSEASSDPPDGAHQPANSAM